MKKFGIVLLFAVLPVLAFAQTDTVRVASDVGSGGNLNTAVANVIAADPSFAQFNNTVFKLEANGFYILTGVIQTPPHSNFRLEGPPPGKTLATSPPQIVWTTSGGVTTTYNFDLFGDATFKNVWILCANVLGAQIGTSILIEDDSLANLSGKGERFEMDGCIVDYQGIGNGGGAIEPACKHFRAKITNTYFRNLTDAHYRYYGRPVSWTFQSTTWHTDTLIFENCTIANVGYAYMQESPEYADYVSFNHCTFLNTVVFVLESSYWWNLSVTNSIVVNAFMYGDFPGTDGTNRTPNGGVLNIDSVNALSFSIPFTDDRTAAPALQRHILFANNSYSHDQWYYDYLAHNAHNDTAIEVNKIHRMPMLSAKTYRFFTGTDSATGAKNFPYMTAFNLYPLDTMSTTFDRPTSYSATYDPGFAFAPTNVDSIKVFLMGRWLTGANINWAFNQGDYGQSTTVWPLNEDLSYSNTFLKTAAMGGFPLGDLHRWWGPNSYAVDHYTAWKAQASAEHDTLAKWLNQGRGTVGVAKQSAIPGKYELGQNYPNPFNPTTEIKYSVPQKSNVSLKVYNVLGQEVATLFNGERLAGNYSVTFDGGQLSSGVYFYRLQAENVSITRKLVLMK